MGIANAQPILRRNSGATSCGKLTPKKFNTGFQCVDNRQKEKNKEESKMSVTATKQSNVVNGIDVDALKGIVEQVKNDPAKGLVEFRVKSEWKGQTRSETSIDAYKIGGKEVQRRFKMTVDEPFELLGETRSQSRVFSCLTPASWWLRRQRCR
jgi:hypothetical protein